MNAKSCGDDRRTQLSRLVDGELSAEEKAQVESHLSGCEPCRELLALFQRNDSLLSNALSTEEFGNAVIEGVVAEIRREGLPPEAKPVEEGVGDWLRARPILVLAAGILFMIGTLTLLNVPQSRQIQTLQGDLAETRSRLQLVSTLQQEQTRQTSVRHDEYEALIRTLRAEDALRNAAERYTLAYVEPTQPHQLVVHASFAAGAYSAFDIYRRGEGEGVDRYRCLNGDRRLSAPKFTDDAVLAGQGYVYKFRAYRSSDASDYSESLPIVMRVPARPAPEKSVGIRCEDVAKNLKMAVFVLERLVNGRAVAERFHVEPGSRLGEVRDVPGVGRVDFRTEFVLERLKEDTQTMAVSYTEPLLDSNGKPVLRRLENDTFVPETVQRDVALSTRPNFCAQLRGSTATPGQPLVDLWKGGWIHVPARD